MTDIDGGEDPRRTYQGGPDKEILRRWMNLAKVEFGFNWPDLEEEIHLFWSRRIDELRKQGVPASQLKAQAPSRETLRLFAKSEHDPTNARAVGGLPIVWDFFMSRYSGLLEHAEKPDETSPHSTKSYPIVEARRLPVVNTLAESRDRLPSKEFVDGMSAFLRTPFTLDARWPQYRRVLKGRYVMYRPDLRHIVDEWPGDQPVRTSLVEIFEFSTGLIIQETQHFSKSEHREERHQVNCGALFQYGEYILGFMNLLEDISFKVLVFEQWKPTVVAGDEPIEEIRGKILVTSANASSPSVRFYCQRIAGDDPEFGLLPSSKLDLKIVEYIKSPIIEKSDIVL